MTDNHSTDIAESEPTSVANNISVSELAARRLGGSEQPTEETPVETPEEEVQESSVEPEDTNGVPEESDESSETEETTEENPEDVLSQIDLDEMSEEDLRDLGKRLGSKAVERFGKLTAQRKAAEEELAQLRASMEAADNNPLKGTQEVKNNPYGNIDSVEGIQTKADEVNGIIEWAEDVLFNSDGYGPEDVVTEVEGKELTKADVRKHLLSARKSRDKFLPAQLKVIQSYQQGAVLQNAFLAKAQEELTWMAGEDNDTRKQYEAMVNDPRFFEITKVLPPEISAQMPYLLAHAANSMYGRKVITDKPANARLNPPKQPTGAGAKAERKASPQVKAMKDMRQRFSKSGNKSDFVTLRTLQMQNR